ncbi:MAG TPA: S8 family serine peptidase, partial [Pyrinomonadaceae bacterium]|nr:S8 family serine peptidase [Pyrinomonadaceae bacterium]
ARGAGQIVAVLDTGVDRRHPALAGRLVGGRDFVDADPDPSEVGTQALGPFGHGTHVAGLVALAAPEARIMPVRVLDQNGMGDMWRLAVALAYAADPDGDPSTDDGADVINMSLASDYESRAVTDIVSEITGEAGMGAVTPAPVAPSRAPVIITAAGNGLPKDDELRIDKEMYPAAYAGFAGSPFRSMLAVGASDTADAITSWSTRGHWVRVLAPGDAITSSVPGGGYGVWKGTSMAAPLVAGQAALMRGAHPEAAPAEINDRIVQSGVAVAGPVARRADALASLTTNGWTTGGPNPVDSTRFFVRQNYLDFFNRAPDVPGLSFWSNVVEECAGNADCIDNRRIHVSGAFFISEEFQKTGYFLYRLNRASFGATLPRYERFMPDLQRIGEGVVVLAPGWDVKLEANKRAFVNAWVTSAEFRARHDSLTNAQYVDRLYADAGVAATADERATLASQITSGAKTRGEALRQVAEDRRLYAQDYNRAFVMMQYFGYLRRNADEAGHAFWLKKLEEHGGDFVAAQMVRSFLVSGEYRERFGQ